MTVQFAPNGSISLKGRTNTVVLGKSIRLGEYEVPGMGEYDVAGVPCKVQNLAQGTVGFIQFESLQFTYLSQVDASISKIDEAADTDVLVVDVRSDDEPNHLKPILKLLEPSYLVLTGTGNTESFQKALGLPITQGTSHKVIKSGLPEEGTTLLTV